MMKLRRSFPDAYETRNESQVPIIFHKWNKYGECPKGTISIKRTPKRNNSNIFHRKVPGVDGYEHEYAIVRNPRGRYHGARAYVNIWKPYVEENTPEFSLAQFWLASSIDDSSLLNTIEVGWKVHPSSYGDKEPRLFIFWTKSGYIGSGCYNLDCPGFVKSHPQFTFDCSLGLTSVYGGQQYELKLEIKRDIMTRTWWLYYNDFEVGHFPPSMFTTLSRGAEEIDFGGEIINHKVGNAHTFTQMGSGHFPEEGTYRAAYFRELQFMDGRRNWNDIDLNSLRPIMENPGCYKVQIGVPGTAYKSYFFYGGPGGIGCDVDHAKKKGIIEKNNL